MTDAPPRPLKTTFGASLPAKGRLEALWRVFGREDRVLIVINPDPDAIGSAVALRRLLRRRVAAVAFAAVNQVKRGDNLRLVAALKLKLPLLGAVDPGQYTKLAMVDSQPAHSPLTRGLGFHLIIDHHPPTAAGEGAAPAFVDLRPALGATSTILAAYLRAARLRPSRKLATALFYGLKTDTQNFSRAGQADDMRAFQWLYPHIDGQLLSEMERASIDRSSFWPVVAALSATRLGRNSAFAFLPAADHPDTLVIVADFLMLVDTVNRAVAAGVCGDKLVVIFRGGGPRQDVGKLAAAAFGALGSAGGHKTMARAEVPLGALEPKTRRSAAALRAFVERQIKNGGNDNGRL